MTQNTTETPDMKEIRVQARNLDPETKSFIYDQMCRSMRNASVKESIDGTVEFMLDEGDGYDVHESALRQAALWQAQNVLEMWDENAEIHN